jgi:hypothetical protein
LRQQNSVMSPSEIRQPSNNAFPSSRYFFYSENEGDTFLRNVGYIYIYIINPHGSTSQKTAFLLLGMLQGKTNSCLPRKTKSVSFHSLNPQFVASRYATEHALPCFGSSETYANIPITVTSTLNAMKRPILEIFRLIWIKFQIARCEAQHEKSSFLISITLHNGFMAITHASDQTARTLRTTGTSQHFAWINKCVLSLWQ